MTEHIKIKLIRWFAAIVIPIVLGIFFSPTASGQIRDNVLRELDKTDRMIERADEAVKEAGSVIGSLHLKRAIRLQDNAKEAFQEIAFRKAIKLTLSARQQAKKAVGAVQASDNNSNKVQREIEQTDDILERANEMVRHSTSQKVSSILEAAIKTQVGAKEFFRNHRLMIALKATLKARDTAKRAVDLAGSNRNNTAHVERELQRTDDLISRATDKAAEFGVGETIHRMLENAKGAQSKAYEKLRSGHLVAAMNQTMRARELTNKALKQMEKAVQPKRVEKYLQQNDRLISDIRDMLSESPNSEAERLLEAALDHQKAARDAYSDGQIQTVIVEAKAARELTNKARNLIED